jgi:hypothetical protein
MTVEVTWEQWLIAGISIWYFAMMVWCRIDPNGPMWGGDNTTPPERFFVLLFSPILIFILLVLYFPCLFVIWLITPPEEWNKWTPPHRRDG